MCRYFVAVNSDDAARHWISRWTCSHVPALIACQKTGVLIVWLDIICYVVHNLMALSWYEISLRAVQVDSSLSGERYLQEG